mmetsp:Transcript_8809/g.22168  ORF Transcript_8809/g.22168 Transcript_8809/m.22168 type:complete len:229 (-) Transcript_8809:1591-2277(-)
MHHTGNLLLLRHGLELGTGEGHAFDVLVLSKDADLAADGCRGLLVVTSDHNHTNTSQMALLDGTTHLSTRRIQNTSQSYKCEIALKFSKSGRISMLDIFRGKRRLDQRGESQAAIGLASLTVFGDLLGETFAQSRRHLDNLAVHVGLCATSQHTVPSTLHIQGLTVIRASGQHTHALAVAVELQNVGGLVHARPVVVAGHRTIRVVQRGKVHLNRFIRDTKLFDKNTH